jgi:hypothetical protein
MRFSNRFCHAKFLRDFSVMKESVSVIFSKTKKVSHEFARNLSKDGKKIPPGSFARLTAGLPALY